MKVGVTLPSFAGDAELAINAASTAERLGLDGVFVFDHLWPMGQPERPAISSLPLLGAVAARTDRVCIGTLVARVGLLDDDLLCRSLESLALIAPRRLVVGMGTGDHKSMDENRAYGLAIEDATQRRSRLAYCASALKDAGIPVWVGGGAPATVAVARQLGLAVNMWMAAPDVVERAAQEGEVTWGGPPPKGLDEAVDLLSGLAEAGATWAVCGWTDHLEHLADARRIIALRGER